MLRVIHGGAKARLAHELANVDDRLDHLDHRADQLLREVSAVRACDAEAAVELDAVRLLYGIGR